MTHFESAQSLALDSPNNLERLRFKTGVRLYTSTTASLDGRSPSIKSYLVGTRRLQCELTISNPIAVFNAIARGASMDEIKIVSGATIEEVDLLIHSLEKGNLLEIKESAIKLSQRYISTIAEKAEKGSDQSKDGAYLQLTNRITPELSQSRWLPDTQDSGVGIISARQRAHIEISGDSQGAYQLFGILLTSGVTHTRLAPSHTRKSESIEERDISAGFLRGSDLGAPFYSRMNSLSKELSLFPMERYESAKEIEPDFQEQVLKIHFGDIDPDLLSKWMSTRQDHLIVSEIDGAMINIGPLVLPGKTPCSRCLSLTLDQPIPEPVTVLERDMAPSAATHYVSGLVASLALQLIDTGKSDLIGSVLVIDLLSLCNTEHISIPLHPMCGCAW